MPALPALPLLAKLEGPILAILVTQGVSYLTTAAIFEKLAKTYVKEGDHGLNIAQLAEMSNPRRNLDTPR